LRLRRIAFWLGIALLALVVLAIGWLFIADLGSFRPQIERWASTETGRHIAINGALHIHLGRQSSVVVEDLHVGNPDWADTSDMLSVGRLEVQLDLRSVFSGPLIIETIALEDVRLLLIESEAGERNWQLGNANEVPSAQQTQGDDQPAVLLQKIDVDRVQITYSNPQRVQPLELNIEHLGQRHRDDDFLDLAFNGTIDGRQATLDGEIGTWNALLEQKDVHFDLDARLDSFTLNANGFIDDLQQPRRPQLKFEARAPDINDLLRLLGVAEEGRGVIDLSGSLSADAQDPLVLDVRGRLGRVEIEARGAFSDLLDFEDMDIDLLAAGDDIRPILAAIGMPQNRESPFMLKIDAQRHGPALVIEKADILFGDARFGLAATMPQFPDIGGAVVDLQINGPDIERFRDMFNLPGQASGAFAMGFGLKVDAVGAQSVQLDLQTSLLEAHAEGSLGQPPDYYGSKLQFRVHSDSLRNVASAYGVADLPARPVEISGGINYGADGIRTSETLHVALGDLTVRADGLIRLAAGAVGSSLDFALSGADLAALAAEFAASDMIPAQPYELAGQLQVGNEGYRLRAARGKLGSAAIDVDGLFVAAAGAVGSHVDFKVAGPAFEELVEHVGSFEVIPGDYELGGHIGIKPDSIDLREFKLHRAGGDVALNLELGVPASRKWMNVDLRAQGPDVRSLLRGVQDFEAEPAPFTIDLRAERRATDWSFKPLDIAVGTATLRASGDLDLNADDSDTRFDFEINIPSTANLGTLHGRRALAQPFTLSGRVNGGGGKLDVDELLATLGPSNARGELHYQAGTPPELTVRISSDSIALAPVLEEPESLPDTQPDSVDGRLIPDIAMPFDAMKKLNASIAVDIGALQKDTLKIRDAVLRAELRDGVLEVAQAGFQASAGAITARARLAPGAAGGSASFALAARDFALGMSEMNRDLAMTADIDISLAGTGDDLRSLLGDSNGVVFVNIRGGRVANNRFIQAIYGNALEEILAAINPFRKSEPYTDFECVVVPLEIANGTVTSTPYSLISTSKIRIISKSVVDLKTESLDVSIRTVPKKGIVISAGELLNPYIKVVGTLAAPSLAVDEKGLLLSGGTAVATGGLSVLARATWDRLSRAKDPCADVAQEGIKALGDRFPPLEVTIRSEAVAAGTES